MKKNNNRNKKQRNNNNNNKKTTNETKTNEHRTLSTHLHCVTVCRCDSSFQHFLSFIDRSSLCTFKDFFSYRKAICWEKKDLSYRSCPYHKSVLLKGLVLWGDSFSDCLIMIKFFLSLQSPIFSTVITYNFKGLLNV